MRFFTPVECDDVMKSYKQPTLIALQNEGIYRRGVCVENLLSTSDYVSCYHLLKNFRKMIFSRLYKEGKLKKGSVVKEYCCYPDKTIEEWRNPILVDVKDHEAAKKPPKKQTKLIKRILGVLKPLISEVYIEILEKQP
eukprot:UN02822